MNPIPPEKPNNAQPAQTEEARAQSLADVLGPSARRYPSANRRASSPPTPRLYIMALIASTLVAAVFCLLYITKPVIIPPPDGIIRNIEIEGQTEPEKTAETTKTTESKPPTPTDTPTSPPHDSHEETNLRVQHVLNASNQDGELSRIVLDVPVIYASRNLRWTETEVTQAREIFNRLADYHEQSRRLRDLGTDILLDWNQLIERSIPAADLRADSPSLPANQEDAALLPRPTHLDTTESIEIRPSGP